jgi:ABC-type uncharacterized transport system permease subunit
VTNGSLSSAFAEATIRTATPLVLAATGELLVERAGLINIGLEGVILGGAFGALVGGSHGGGGSTLVGFAVAAAAGMLIMLVFAAATLGMGADQIITGSAITLLALGATGTPVSNAFGAGGPALSVATSARSRFRSFADSGRRRGAFRTATSYITSPPPGSASMVSGFRAPTPASRPARDR